MYEKIKSDLNDSPNELTREINRKRAGFQYAEKQKMLPIHVFEQKRETG